jgi:type I restriction enzyme, S subunit
MKTLETVRIGEILQAARTPVSVDPEAKYVAIGMKSFGRGIFHYPPASGAQLSKLRYFQFPAGALALSNIKAWEGAIGVSSKRDEVAVASNRFLFYVPRDSNRVDVRYLYHYFVSGPGLVEIGHASPGSADRNRTLSIQGFQNILVPLPAIEEQRRIVDLISSADSVISQVKKCGMAADKLWWSLTKELMDEVSGNQTVRLDSIAEISGGLTKNAKDALAEDLLDVPYLRVANVHRRYLDLSDVATIKVSRKKLAALKLEVGDILLNEGGDKDKLGRGAVWRGEIECCIHQNHVFRARLTSRDYLPGFVSSWANSFGKGWFERFGTQTTGIASINKATLSRFPVPVLPPERQREWVDLLDNVAQQCESHKKKAGRLEALRAGLLTALLTTEHEIPKPYDALLGV